MPDIFPDLSFWGSPGRDGTTEESFKLCRFFPRQRRDQNDSLKQKNVCHGYYEDFQQEKKD